MPQFLVVNSDWPRPVDSDTYDRKGLGKTIAGLSGWTPVCVHHVDVRADEVARAGYCAIVLSGCAAPWSERPAGAFDEVHRVIRETATPVLGICGGHQVIAFAYGCPVERMRALRPGEPDADSSYLPGFLKETGYAPVRRIAESPLLEGLPEEFLVREWHGDEVRELPPGFRLLASTTMCRVQAMQSLTRPIFGTQFHPEVFDDSHPHGRRVLENFIRIAAAAAPPPTS
jgi:GMP synthase (glutamine-hydrolysing)